jgi:uncharacterized protein YciI
MFVIVLRYVQPLSEVDRLAPAHFEHLDTYYEQGIILVSGRRVPRVGGVIIAHGTTLAEVESMMRADPFVSEGIATYEIIEFSPGKTDPRLADVISAAR